MIILQKSLSLCLKRRNPEKKIPAEGAVIKYLAGIMKEVGLIGFIVLVIASVFLIWGTTVQKREFIDTFILLKNTNQNQFPCVIVILTLFLLLVIGSIYSNKMLKLRREENNRIGKEKSVLQEKLLGKSLNSSD